jgi:NADH-quinone oxidoreductase subunit H
MAATNRKQASGGIRPYLNLFAIFAVLGIATLGALLFAAAIGGNGEDTWLGALWSNILGGINNLLTWIFDPSRVATANVIQCRTDSGCSTVQAIVFSLIFFFVILTSFAYTTLLERVVLARLQQRSGPNRVGPGGLLQPAADGVKLIFKEDITPSGADKLVYYISPILKAVPALILLAVVPLGPDLIIPWFDGNVYQVPLGLIDVNVGILWLLAVTSISTYGVVLAGWSSNNKYAMIGGLRASAQMLSYELSLGLTMAVPVLIVGSMSVGDIVREQRMFYEWFVFQNPLAAGILAIALLAEISRAPFDLPEAEQELTQGFMTEYSGMKFAMIMMAEYLGMIGIAVVIASLFLGGYQDGFGIVDSLPILGPLVLGGKIILLLFVMIWVRATLPRIRYDRLMAFGWKVMLPLALVAVTWTAIATLVGDLSGNPIVYGIVSGLFFLAIVVGGYLLLSRGESKPAEENWENDPIITGERKGIGWGILQAIGALIAIPFALFEYTVKQLENLANLAPEEPKKPRDDQQSATKSSGGD